MKFWTFFLGVFSALGKDDTYARSLADGEDIFYLKNVKWNTYIRSDVSGGRVYMTDSPGANEKFQFVQHGGHFAIKSVQFNNYLSASTNNRAVTFKSAMNSNEKWNIKYISHGKFEIETVSPQTETFLRGGQNTQTTTVSIRDEDWNVWIIQRTPADFIKHIVDNELHFYLKSVYFGTYLMSEDVAWYDEAEMKETPGPDEQLKLEANGNGYAIKSVKYDTYLGALPLDGDYSDSLVWKDWSKAWERWQFLPLDDNQMKFTDIQWAVKSPIFNTYLRSDDDGEDLHCVPWRSTWEAWEIVLLEDRKVDHIKFHLDDMSMLKGSPVSIGKMTVTSKCPEHKLDYCRDATESFTVSQSSSKTASFSYTTSVSVMQGITLSAGVPGFGEAEATLEITFEHSITVGTEIQISEGWEHTTECVAGPGLKATCEYIITKQVMDIPFTITLNTGEIETGVYRGVSFLDGHFTVRNEEVFSTLAQAVVLTELSNLTETTTSAPTNTTTAKTNV